MTNPPAPAKGGFPLDPKDKLKAALVKAMLKKKNKKP